MAFTLGLVPALRCRLLSILGHAATAGMAKVVLGDLHLQIPATQASLNATGLDQSAQRLGGDAAGVVWTCLVQESEVPGARARRCDRLAERVLGSFDGSVRIAGARDVLCSLARRGFVHLFCWSGSPCACARRGKRKKIKRRDRCTRQRERNQPQTPLNPILNICLAVDFRPCRQRRPDQLYPPWPASGSTPRSYCRPTSSTETPGCALALAADDVRPVSVRS